MKGSRLNTRFGTLTLTIALLLTARSPAADPPEEADLPQDHPGHPAHPHRDRDALPPEPTSDPAVGGPTVLVFPPHGTRFAPGQRFDIRVEGTGTGPSFGFAASLWIDGEPHQFTSGTVDANTTDGISKPGWGGFNLRGYSNDVPGVHEIAASFSSSQGTKVVRSSFVVEALEPLGGAKVRNVILLLGDGMGIGVRTAARVARFGVSRGSPKGWLEMDRFPTHGIATTHSGNSYLTDSAPGMSAYSTGTHNNNNTEGVFTAQVVNNFFHPRVEYLSEYLHRTQGKVTGIVTTADVEDATPGAMAAHTGDRNAGTGIVDQFLDEADTEGSGAFGSGLRVLLGGGRKWFLPAGTPGSGRTAATDYPALPADLTAAWGLPASGAGAIDPGRDLIEDFIAAGFTYVWDVTSLEGATSGRPPAALLGLFHLANMNVAVDKIAERRGVPVEGAVEVAGAKSPFAVVQDGFPDQPMLDEMAEAAIKVLSQYPDGFVLLIEGASIDKQEHAQDSDRTVGDAIEFDRAVGVARRFAEADKQTLVLVLSDHECAGFVAMGGLLHPVTGKNEGSLEYLRGLPSDAGVLDPAVQPERQKVIGTNFGGGRLSEVQGPRGRLPGDLQRRRQDALRLRRQLQPLGDLAYKTLSRRHGGRRLGEGERYVYPRPGHTQRACRARGVRRAGVGVRFQRHGAFKVLRNLREHRRLLPRARGGGSAPVSEEVDARSITAAARATVAHGEYDESEPCRKERSLRRAAARACSRPKPGAPTEIDGMRRSIPPAVPCDLQINHGLRRAQK